MGQEQRNEVEPMNEVAFSPHAYLSSTPPPS